MSNYIQTYHKTLNLYVRRNIETGNYECGDGVKYKAKEIDILKKAGLQIDLKSHIVKKIFKGEIVEVKKV